MTSIIDPNPPITDSTISEFESQYGLRLPEDYRSFLLDHNGGRPDNVEFDFVRYSEDSFRDGSWVGRFYGFGERIDLEDAYNNGIAYGAPRHIIPIANTAGKEAVVMSLAKEDYGVIYFEDTDSEGPPIYHRITDSFSAFFDDLRPKSSEG